MRPLVGAALLVTALAAPQAAHAAGNVSASFSNNILSIVGDDEAQTLTVGVDGSNNITVADDGAPVTITGGTPTTANTSQVAVSVSGGNDSVTITTPLNGGPTETGGQPEIEITVDAGAGNDTISIMGGTAPDNFGVGELGSGDAGINVNGDGDGDDVRSNAETFQLNTGMGADSVRDAQIFLGPINRTLVVNAGPGNDSIDGGRGMSILNGNEDNDSLGILGGNNVVDGGPGMNTGFLIFGGMLNINQNGDVLTLSGSGISGTLTQLHNLFASGSNGNDTLTAGSVALPITIQTLGGNDTIDAGMARDLVLAGAGNDIVRAGGGDDDLFGDQGDDELRGQGGTDNVDGGDGNDSCEGETQAFCEILIVDPAPGGGQPGGGGNPPGVVPNPLLPTPNPFTEAPILRGFVRTVQNQGIDGFLNADGFFLSFQARPGVYELLFVAPRGSIIFPESAAAAGRGKRIVLAKARKRVTTAGRVRMRVKPTRSGRRALRRARRARITVSAKYTSPTGERYSASRKVTIKKKRKRR
jgi:Ca2+-binding RTX toxin-like protein